MNCDANKVEELENPFYVSPETQDFSQNPALLERILSGPHGYLRFINREFSQEVCNHFRNTLVGTPSFNLHGDAHIEQYAVTDLGRGLTDYDDSSTGPAVLDWMRFGVSLRFACRAKNWENDSNRLFNEFLNGYRAALKNPQTEAAEPVVSKRYREEFKSDRKSYFEWVESEMDPMPEEEYQELLKAMKPYVETMLAENPDYQKDYFSVKNMGYLRMGIGSALDLKYLVRVEGETDDSFDDVVLEIKEVRDLSEIDCINTGQKTDPFRILLGQARIAYQPFHHLGYFRFQGLNFWVHSWVENYEEVKIAESFQNPDEIAEVAYDIGVQLGRGHVKHIAAPLDLQLRREQLSLLEKYEDDVKKACQNFEKKIIEAWKKFGEEIK